MPYNKQTFEDYLVSLSQVSKGVSPLEATPESTALKQAADELGAMDGLSISQLAEWVRGAPKLAHALGVAVGLSQEQLKNILKTRFDTQSATKVARSAGRRSASRAGAAGRSIEDRVEVIAYGLGLNDIQTRTQFPGRSGTSTPCDVLVRDSLGEPFAVVDGIGWRNRLFDLKKIHEMWMQNDIDGLYTLNTLDVFREDLKQAATRTGLIGLL